MNPAAGKTQTSRAQVDAKFDHPCRDRQTRAYRLKLFSRCPACDEKKLVSFESIFAETLFIHCTGCGFRHAVPSAAAIQNDLVVLKIVDAAMRYGPGGKATRS